MKTRFVLFSMISAALLASLSPVFAAKGRYVHVTIPGSATLSLAEVQVFSGDKNVALNKPAVQSATSHGGSAIRAVDGNTNGDWGKGSITHTPEGAQNPRWEVDLGADANISSIVLWNRDGLEGRLNNAHVLILDASRKVVWGEKLGKAPKGKTAFDVAAVPGKVMAGQQVKKVGATARKAPAKKKRRAAPPAPKGPPPAISPVRYSGSEADRRKANRGVLNGPMMQGGHKASGQGNAESLKLAIEDLLATYGDRYPNGKAYLERLAAIKDINAEDFLKLKKEALLANPILDFNGLMMVRSKQGKRYTANWQTKTTLGRNLHYSDEIVMMSPICDGEVKVIHKAENKKYLGDVDLHFDADRMLFSSQDDKGVWGVYELTLDPKTGAAKGAVRRMSPDMGADVDNYDACYLPNGRVIFSSTAAYDGVPCVGGKAYVANLYLMNADGTGVRRLCFDQDGNWHPTVMENGRVMYTRWEYTDSAHYYSRVLMTMNPDGTDQKAYYGSNSYWPNSMFFAKPIPGSPSKFISTITGHHSHAKGGALCLFDVSKGRHEADGAVQFITGRGKKVEPLVIDGLHRAYNPMFFEPYPLNDKYFLAMSGRNIYLLDVFDNMLLLKAASKEEGGYYEPIPFRKTKKPFEKPDMVNVKDKTATVLISDIYEGPGLAGVPRGEVKKIRVYRYEYGPRNKGGHYAMGMETCWDARQILGTAPVDADGSASFKIPANSPVALQPLDEEGRALAIMRSWFVGMPGERLSCVGCHESQNSTTPPRRSTAMLRMPSELEPWNGPARAYGFADEVMPVIDRRCVGCHDGSTDTARLEAMGVKVADRVVGTGPNTGKKFSEVGIPGFQDARTAHANLHPYVRRNGPEGDYHLLTPLEFHADTSELIQMLKKGHHNVRLDAAEWDRLYTWIDLNAPLHANWTQAGANQGILKRRMELRQLYALDDFNPEAIVNPYTNRLEFIAPQPYDLKPGKVEKPMVKDGRPADDVIDLGDGITMKLVGIPAGEFSMGSNDETPQERPISRVKIAKGFLMGATEVTLEQYRLFEPDYLNGVYDMHYKDQVKRGYYMNDMKFPVIRVSWEKALEYCDWLSKKTGKKISLPTEAQWEWACRAGGESPLCSGDLDSDFSKYANLADYTVRQMAVSGVNPRPISNPNPTVDFELKDPRYNDGILHLARAGSYQPNAWGLYDMHGNAVEWTLSAYQPYPYADDGRNKPDAGTMRVVRGGSWHDRPFRATASYRVAYPAWQRVYNAGFRVVAEK